MIRPAISGTYTLLRKYNIVVESMCNRKKDQLHCHDFVQLWYVFTGTLRHTVGDNEYLQTPGSCVIVLPFTDHAINTLDSEDTPVTLSLSFTDDFFTERNLNCFSYLKDYAHFDGCFIPEFSVFNGKEKETADNIARNILSEFSPNKDPDFDVLSKYLYNFMHHLCHTPAKTQISPIVIEQAKSVLRAVRYISNNLNKKVTREDLCAITAMSRTNFSKAFKEVTGVTTKDFLLGLRIRRAQYLLQYTDKSLNEIAKDIGLYDKSHLAHIFCENIGTSPIQFRYQTRPEALESDKQTRRRMKFYPKNLSDIDISPET